MEEHEYIGVTIDDIEQFRSWFDSLPDNTKENPHYIEFICDSPNMFADYFKESFHEILSSRPDCYLFIKCYNVNIDMLYYYGLYPDPHSIFSDLDNLIGIEGGFYQESNMYYGLDHMFENCANLEYAHIRFQGIASCAYTFYGCTSLHDVNIEHTYEFITMDGSRWSGMLDKVNFMFEGCRSLKYLNADFLSHVTQCTGMMENSGIESFDYGVYDLAGSVQPNKASDMFFGCDHLQQADISFIGLDIKNLESNLSGIGLGGKRAVLFHRYFTYRDGTVEINAIDYPELSDIYLGVVAPMHDAVSSSFKDYHYKAIKIYDCFDSPGTLKLNPAVEEVYFDTSAETITDISDLFKSCSSLLKVDLSRFKSINVAFEACFNCDSLEQIIGVENFKSIKNAYSMFENCSRLTADSFIHSQKRIPVGTTTFTNVIDATSMFSGCYILDVDASNFLHAESCGYMFDSVKSVTNVHMSSIVDGSNMFYGVEEISIKRLSFENLAYATYMFAFSKIENLTLSDRDFWMVEEYGIDNIFEGVENLTINCSFNNRLYQLYTEQYGESSNITWYIEVPDPMDGIPLKSLHKFLTIWASSTTEDFCKIKIKIEDGETYYDGRHIGDVLGDFYPIKFSVCFDEGARDIRYTDNMFASCYNIVEFDSKYLDNVYSADEMFFDSGLTRIDTSGFRKLYSAVRMFSSCQIASLDLSNVGEESTQSYINFDEICSYCQNLTEIVFPKNISHKYSLYFACEYTKLNHIPKLPRYSSINGCFGDCYELSGELDLQGWNCSNGGAQGATSLFQSADDVTKIYNLPYIYTDEASWLVWGGFPKLEEINLCNFVGDPSELLQNICDKSNYPLLSHIIITEDQEDYIINNIPDFDIDYEVRYNIKYINKAPYGAKLYLDVNTYEDDIRNALNSEKDFDFSGTWIGWDFKEQWENAGLLENLRSLEKMPIIGTSLKRLFSGNTYIYDYTSLDESKIKCDTDIIDEMYNNSQVEIPWLPLDYTSARLALNNCVRLISFPKLSDKLKDASWMFSYTSSASGTLTIPKSVEDLESICDGCSSLEKVIVLADSIRQMFFAFHDCFNLKSITIAKQKQIINDYNDSYKMSYAFYGCSSLKEISIYNSNLISDGGLFFNCTSLESLTLGFKPEQLRDWWDPARAPNFKNVPVRCVIKTPYEEWLSVDRNEEWCSLASSDIRILSADDYLTPENLNRKLAELELNSKAEPYQLMIDLDNSILNSEYQIVAIKEALKNNPYKYVDLSSCDLYVGDLPKTVEDIRVPEYADDGSDNGGVGDGIGTGSYSTTVAPGTTPIEGLFSDCNSLIGAPILYGSDTYLSVFENCVNLKQVEIPVDATVIDGMFKGCTSLEDAPIITDSVISMKECFCNSGVTSMPVIPNSVNDMSSAFAGSKLTSTISIPSSVKIMDSCFRECRDLTKVESIPSTVNSLSDCFRDCVSLSQVSSFEVDPTSEAVYNIFLNTPKTLEVYVPTSNYAAWKNRSYLYLGLLSSNVFLSVTVIDIADLEDWIDNAEASSIESPYMLRITGDILGFNKKIRNILNRKRNVYVDLSSTRIEITDSNSSEVTSLFEGCSTLISTPELSYTGTDGLYLYSTFSDCTNLIHVTNIPFGTVSMDGTFNGCSSLAVLDCSIPNSVTTMYNTFKNTSLVNAPSIPINAESIFGIYSGTRITKIPEIPASVTDASAAFMRCTSLNKVRDLSDNIINCDSMFFGCSNIKYVESIPANAENCSNMFSGSTNLTVCPAIPSNVKYASNMFSGCTKLEYVAGFDYFEGLESFEGMFANIETEKVILATNEKDKLESWININAEALGRGIDGFTIRDIYTIKYDLMDKYLNISGAQILLE